MRVPIRKPGKYTHAKLDAHLTEEKFNELKRKLNHLKTVSHPQAAVEVTRLAEMGDFSENAAYQMAKGRLRGINNRILELEDLINRATLIKPAHNAKTVQLGSTVTVEMGDKQQRYVILGSAEANPAKGIISQHSPIGSALMEHAQGDIIALSLAKKRVTCRIISID